MRAVVREAGYSYDLLARAVRRVAAESGRPLTTNRQAVGHWVSRGTLPGEHTRWCVAEALSRATGRPVTVAEVFPHGVTDTGDQPEVGLDLGTDPVEQLRAVSDGDMQRRDVLRAAVYSTAAAALPLGTPAEAAERADKALATGRAGAPDVAAVRDIVRALVAVDETHGGQHGRRAVVAWLHDEVLPLCRARYGDHHAHSAMLSAAAAGAYLCGWKARDAGEHGLAQRYYLQAWNLCREAGDEQHAAFVLRILAHNGMDLSEPAHTMELADTAEAQAERHVGPAARSIWTITRARAHAYAGHDLEARRALDEARTLLDQDDGDPLPWQAALWGAPRATVASHTAKTLSALGDHDASAQRHLAAARAYGTDDTSGERVRIVGLSLAEAADEHYAAGHLDQACARWHAALDRLDGVGSARVTDQIDSIRRKLSAPRLARSQSVRELLDRVTPAGTAPR